MIEEEYLTKWNAPTHNNARSACTIMLKLPGDRFTFLMISQAVKELLFVVNTSKLTYFFYIYLYMYLLFSYSTAASL